MPVIADIPFTKFEDGTLTISLEPSVAIGGWNIQFQVWKRFGGESGLITKSTASGYNNVSGIDITNSGLGIFDISIGSHDTSGLDFGNYASKAERLTSGNRTVLTEGYLILTP